MARSNSQSDSPSGRLAYLMQLLIMHIKRRVSPPDFVILLDEIQLYRSFLSDDSGIAFSAPKAMEIGVGQRPYRLISMQSLGVEAWGIDLDKPIVSISFRDFINIWKENGIFRAVKSAGRSIMFDKSDYNAFRRAFFKRFGKMTRDTLETLVVGDAAEPATWAKTGARDFDLIYSDDVFEHIPRADIERILEIIALRLSKRGVAVIAPMIYTGISGDHSPQWYPHRVLAGEKMATPAWGHLTGQASSPDTYLNRLTRADYRTLFQRRFQIVSETVLLPDLGRAYFDERKEALFEYSEDELFSNKVRFVLKAINSHVT